MMPHRFRGPALTAVALLLAAGLPAQAAKQTPAAPPAKQAMSFSISVDNRSSHYMLPLSQGVYGAVNRQDLGDICIRNQAGENLPYALARPPVERTKLLSTSWTDTPPWFPMPVEGEAALDAPLGVAIAPDGSLRAAPGSRPASQKRPGDIIPLTSLWAGKDLAEVQNVRVTLNIDISEPEYRGRLHVLESDELRAGRTVGSGQLTFLRNNADALVSNRVELNGVSGRYLFLMWDDTPPTLTGISVTLTAESYERPAPPRQPDSAAEAEAAGKAQPLQRQWLVDLPGEKDPDGGFAYHLNSHLPVDFVQLALPRANTVVSAELYSGFQPGDRRNAAGGRQKFYRLTQNGTETRNPPTALPLNRDSEWWLRISGPTAGMEEAPRLAVSWEPDQLTFLASGDGPYTLVTGCSGPGPQPLGSLYADVVPKTVESAHLGAGTPLAAEPKAEPPTDTRKYILWGVLLLGLGLLGFMAYKLLKNPQSRA